jgi:MFS transporter, YQGE family, putative transporter
MSYISDFYNKERSYLKRISLDAKNLVKSIFLFNAILPLLSIFLTAFLFRQTESQVLVGVFYIFLFSGITLAFYFNGFLLKKYRSNILMIAGLIFKSLVFLVLIFYPANNLIYIILFGLLYGIVVGIYWANRNFLTLIATESENRIYFSSLESLSKSASDIITPLFIGIFLTAIAYYTQFTNHDGYKILSILMFIIIIWTILVAIRIKTPLKDVSLLVKNNSRKWKIFRFYNFSLGFLTIGTILLPPLMIFRLVGEEGSLGTLQSIAALLSAILVYGMAKSMQTQNRFRLIKSSTVISLIGIITYSLTYSPIGVFTFMAAIALSQPFWWTYMSSLSYDLIQSQELKRQYAGLCDREIYLNLGRNASITLFILMIFVFSDDFALRFLPLAFAFFQILALFMAKSIEKHN